MIGNLFNIASGAIGGALGRDTILYKKFIGNSTNDVGMLVPSYEDTVEINGSFQVVSSYQALDKEDWYSFNGWNGVLCVRL